VPFASCATPAAARRASAPSARSSRHLALRHRQQISAGVRTTMSSHLASPRSAQATAPQAPAARSGVDQVDVRGPRFVAWITTAVLVLVLLAAAVSPALATVLIAVQAVVFGAGALLGPRRSEEHTSEL